MSSRTQDRIARRAAGLSLVIAGLLAHGSVLAQTASDQTGPAQAAAAPAAQAAPSPDAMTNLIRLLVAKGTLSQADGDALLAQAQSEAERARAAMAPPPPPPPVPEGAVRVTHVPEVVRQQIRDEIRGEIMAQAATEGWVTKNQAAPEWSKRIRLFGDIRVRSQSDLYSKTNSDQILDIAALNNKGPVDLSNLQNLEFLNTRRDRTNRTRLRARIGLEAEVTKGVTAGFQVADGDDNSPISPNSALANGFGKPELWIDLAYIKAQPKKWATFWFGRFQNPFNTTPLLFDEDLRFDGVAGQLEFADVLGEKSSVRLTGGAFPLDDGPSAYPNEAIVKQKFPSKWLFSGELKLKAQVFNDVKLEASVGYHSFKNVQGRLSDPCNLDLGPYCSTDGLRPQFLRKGNTVFTMRNLVVNSTGIYPQVFGLKFDYDILDVNVAARIPVNDVLGVRIAGTYLQNLGFKRGDICSGQFDTATAFLVEPFNNYGADGNADRHICTKTNPTSFVGGNKGYMGSITFGNDAVLKRGNWQVFGEYRYLESDAVLDAYTDSDFHLAGTNAKGYVIGGEYGIVDGVSIGGRWLSADQISGDPLSIDVLQIDLIARF